MTDYNKLTKPDLEAKLKERGLPHTGKKADLVARLQGDDKKKDETGPEAATTESNPKAAAEDEIDWDDDAEVPAASKEAPATEAKPVPASTAPSNPAPTETKAAEETTSEPAEVAADAQATEEKPREKTPVDFSIGLANITIDEEIEKRKARAKKFGIEEADPSAEEALQRLERAKKFGEDATGPKGLNEALPERRPKRGRDGNDERGDFKRRGNRGFRGGRGGQGRGNGQRSDRGGGGDRRPQQPKSTGGSSNWMTDNDKKAAEARKARFAS
jgi:SAP domain-containing ribonucleoprotein